MRIGQHADLVVVAPATADLLARAAHGMADDLLTLDLLDEQPVVDPTDLLDALARRVTKPADHRGPDARTPARP